MSTLAARTGSDNKTGLVPVLDDAAWFAKYKSAKPPPTPVVFIGRSAPVALASSPLPQPPPVSVRAPTVEELLLHYREVYSLDTPNNDKHTSKREARRLIATIARQHGFRFHDIIGPSREAKLMKARQAAVLEIAERFPHWSLPTLGRLFNRDHTTILYSLRKARSA